VLLTLKLVLVPALVAGVTLGARRWGPRVGGWLTALPLVAGPTLLFLALEQGEAFAARAASGTLVGLIAVAAFGLAYGRLARGRPWAWSLVGGWAAFGATTAALQLVPWTPSLALLATLGAFALAGRLLPDPGRHLAPAPPPAWDLPLRMLGTLAVVLGVTSLADRLGPDLSGALTPFPVALGVVLVFAHAQQGAAPAIALLHGFLPGMWGFALFCLVLSLTMVALGAWAALLAALGAQGAVHGVVLWHLIRSGRV
jgi:hypothetical protein